MKQFVLLLGLILQSGYTFDPHSVEQIWYRASDCEHVSVTKTACSRVILRFGAMIPTSPETGSETPRTSTYVPPAHPDAPKVLFHYEPKDCKPLPNSDRYVCTDPRWKKAGAVPSIWWEEIGVKAFVGETEPLED